MIAVGHEEAKVCESKWHLLENPLVPLRVAVCLLLFMVCLLMAARICMIVASAYKQTQQSYQSGQ